VICALKAQIEYIDGHLFAHCTYRRFRIVIGQTYCVCVRSDPLHFFKFPKNLFEPTKSTLPTLQPANPTINQQLQSLNPSMADPPRPKSRATSTTTEPPRPKSRTTRNSQATDHGQGISASSTVDARHVAEILAHDPESQRTQGQHQGKEAPIESEGRAGRPASRAASTQNATTTIPKTTAEGQPSMPRGALTEAIESQRRLKELKGKGRETAEAYSNHLTERSNTHDES
jgi:hypothetical protein